MHPKVRRDLAYFGQPHLEKPRPNTDSRAEFERVKNFRHGPVRPGRPIQHPTTMDVTIVRTVEKPPLVGWRYRRRSEIASGPQEKPADVSRRAAINRHILVFIRAADPV